ncbi:MAG TPA: DUF2252 family protein [Polyangia bacterium]|nr:DUF2252 family protein [Polyangia bacterium]
MDIVEATHRYETWLARFMPLVRPDIDEKHRRMQLGPFLFLRATFYRWCQLWHGEAGDAGRATRVLAVGDLHLENFGTWRDADGRLIWGINDFDEATRLPWTQDLVRLAAGAYLAIGGEIVGLGRRAASDAILEGYRAGIEAAGPAFVLEEEHGWLRRIAMTRLRHPTTFWQKLNGLPTARAVDPAAAAAIRAAMPAPNLRIRFARRVAGMGSLGHPRVVGIADWHGGRVAREAKALAPSAWLWATGRSGDTAIRYQEIIDRAIRVPDPTVRPVGSWLIRRLAPHCTRIELLDLPDGHDEARLLHAMGFETANVHLGTAGAARAIRRELDARKSRWLHDSAKKFSAEVTRDWRAWRNATR